jgi:hypothetical protein
MQMYVQNHKQQHRKVLIPNTLHPVRGFEPRSASSYSLLGLPKVWFLTNIPGYVGMNEILFMGMEFCILRLYLHLTSRVWKFTPGLPDFS